MGVDNGYGAKDIAVIVVHNNMPLDWLLRQLCLARFLYLGVNDLHFSDTQEMGTLAKSYDDLIHTYSQALTLAHHDVEEQVFAWFKKNISEEFSDKSDEHLRQEFTQFKSMADQFNSRITIHSLANEFAKRVELKPHMQKPSKGDCAATALLSVGSQGVHAADKGLLFFSQSHSSRLKGKEDSTAANDQSMTQTPESRTTGLV